MWSDVDSTFCLAKFNGSFDNCGNPVDCVARWVALWVDQLEAFVKQGLKISTTRLFRYSGSFDGEVTIDKKVNCIGVYLFNMTF